MFPNMKKQIKTVKHMEKTTIRNPTNMKNFSNENRTINVDNIFSVNRLGLSNYYESGRSITLGLDYKKESVFYKNNDD